MKSFLTQLSMKYKLQYLSNEFKSGKKPIIRFKTTNSNWSDRVHPWFLAGRSTSVDTSKALAIKIPESDKEINDLKSGEWIILSKIDELCVYTDSEPSKQIFKVLDIP